MDADNISQSGVQNVLGRLKIKSLVKLFQTQKLRRDQVNVMTTEVTAADASKGLREHPILKVQVHNVSLRSLQLFLFRQYELLPL